MPHADLVYNLDVARRPDFLFDNNQNGGDNMSDTKKCDCSCKPEVGYPWIPVPPPMPIPPCPPCPPYPPYPPYPIPPTPQPEPEPEKGSVS